MSLSRINQIGIIVKLDSKSALEITKGVVRQLLKDLPSLQIYAEETLIQELDSSDQKKIELAPIHAMCKKADAIISIGGDGTILRCSRYLLHKESWKTCSLIGVNAGKIGFLSTLSGANAARELPGYLKEPSKLQTEDRCCLEVSIERKNEEASQYHVLNDCVISKGSLSRIFESKVWLDGEFLSSYRADGLIVSPPTGSTAYNLAAGGAIVEPNTPTIQITPIAPQSLTNKAIVVSNTHEISLRLGRHSTDVFLTMDGHTGCRVDDNDVIRIRKSPKKIQFLIPAEEMSHYYFRSLRQKLNWGLEPEPSA